MRKRVVLVGHCGPDSSYLRAVLSSVDRGVEISAVDDEQSLTAALENGADLVLFNRMLDYGFEEAEGVKVLARIHRQFPQAKLIMVSNYPEAQAAAVAAGALPGFGKRELGTSRVREILKSVLSDTSSTVQQSKAI